MILILLVLVVFAIWVLVPLLAKKKQHVPNSDQYSENRKWDEYRVAIHEAGHLVAAWSCSHVLKIHRAHINEYGGKVEWESVREDSADNHWCHLVIMLAGISAENLVYGKMVSTGSRSDLLKAQDLVERLLLCEPDYKPPTKATGKSIDFTKMYTVCPSEKEIEVLSAAYRHAQSIMRGHKEKFIHVAVQIHNQKSLSEPATEKILGSRNFIKMLRAFRPVFVYPGSNIIHNVSNGVLS